MSHLVGNISLVSGLTIVSRFLGLARDVLFFTCFGVSAIGDAFILAFTIPNLFRRMLGEGTLTSAYIPVYSEIEKNQSLEMAHRVLNQVISRLFVFLLALSLSVCLVSWMASDNQWISSQKWINGLYLNSIIFPYVFFICISAIVVGTLNTHRKFFAGAFSPIILNLSMIGVLVFLYFGLSWRGMDLVTGLCFAVLLGGVLQTIIPWIQLRRNFSWRWKFDLASSEGLEKIKTLFFVGAFGAAVSQINVMVSRFLAYSLDSDGALSYLFLSARLIELPLGVFAISISTVFFPELSRAFISGEGERYDNCFARGFRLTLGIILPAAIGLALLSDTILSVLFQWGEFGGGEVDIASSVLIISCFALPFYAIAAYFVKAFHSQKDMNSPLKAAVLSFLINLALSIILMQEYGMLGLAWANVGAAFFQTIFLAAKFKGFDMKFIFRPDSLYVFSISIASLVMFGLLWFFKDQQYFAENKLHSVLELLTYIPLGVLIYALSLALLGFPELKYFRQKMGLPN